MHLTQEEVEMLDGKYGYPVQKNMEILVSLGECYGAQKMLPVTSVHLIEAVNCIYKAGALFAEEMADKGGKFVTFTTVNPQVIDLRLWKDKDVGISEERFNEQMALNHSIGKMGTFLCYTCTPYLVGNIPRPGQHVAWCETSAVIFANSVLGARTNREGAPSALASALTGRTPEYGYHLDQNRYGDLEISVTARLNGIADYGALGQFIGKVAGDRVPVLTGIPPSVSLDELIHIGTQAPIEGMVSLYHIVGITPEAPTKEAAFGPKKAGTWERFEFGEKELRETEGSLSKATGRNVDLVIFGCSHASIEQIREIAQLLSGRRLKSGVELWITTSRIVLTYAENMGYVDCIEASGARILGDVCPMYIAQENFGKHGPRVVASNSARVAYGMPTIQDAPAHYGSTKRCIEAAISGIWR
jgi:predicted aconitase